ncbi:hypothetical protein O6H91_Y128200 [Diphasiastrum complanatum]|nr:hypothetical protein O6H91_Y128200 [Diphasiastrum complanatum]
MKDAHHVKVKTRGKLESTSAFHKLPEQRSPERTEQYNSLHRRSHVQSKLETRDRHDTAGYYSDVPEFSCTEDGDGTLIDDSSSRSLVTCRSLRRSKRGSRKHFPISPLSQNVLDLALTKSPLRVASPMLSSRSRRSQLTTSADATDSSDFRRSSPYVNLRKQTETSHGIEQITSPKKRSSRPRKGLFLGFSSCCKNDTSQNENFKLKSSTKSSTRQTSPVRSHEIWEKDRAWNVLANVDNHTIKKKVILKRSLTPSRLNAAEFGGSLPSTSVIESASSCQTEPSLKLETVSCPLESRLGATSSTSYNYRLSTSSADASLEVDAFTWDKEHSSFTSEDSMLTYFELLKPGRHGQMPIDETLASDSSLVVSTECVESSLLSQRHISASGSISTAKIDEIVARTEDSRSAALRCDKASGKTNQRRYAATRFEECGNGSNDRRALSSKTSSHDIDAHSPSKISCQTCMSHSMHSYKDSKVDVANQTGGFSCSLENQLLARTEIDLNAAVDNIPVAEVAGTNPSTSQVTNKHTDDSPPQDFNSDHRKVRESVAVVVVSNDPYHDFRQSMLEMVMGKRLSKTGELEELLQYYLSLNPPCFHDVIIEVFTDLWLQLLHIS